MPVVLVVSSETELIVPFSVAELLFSGITMQQ